MNVSISMHRKKSSMLRNYKHYHHLYLYKQNVQSLDHYLTAKNPEKIYNKDGIFYFNKLLCGRHQNRNQLPNNFNKK